jgi:hypothetical protein
LGFVREVALVGVAGWLVSCTTQGESCSLSSSEIAMHASVFDDALGIAADVELRSDEVGSLSLCEIDGDTLTINGKTPTTVETPTGSFFYTVTFESAPQSYEFRYERPKRNDTIVASVTAPPDFSIVAPQEGASISRAVDLLVEWEPGSEGEIALAVGDELGYECLLPLAPQSPIPDEGSFVLPAGSLAEGDDTPVEGACEVDVELTRERVGDYPGALASGGQVTALVKRHVRFVSVP